MRSCLQNNIGKWSIVMRGSICSRASWMNGAFTNPWAVVWDIHMQSHTNRWFLWFFSMWFFPSLFPQHPSQLPKKSHLHACVSQYEQRWELRQLGRGFTRWNIYTMEYYSVIKKNSFESVLMRWMKLEPIIQSEVSQKDKEHYSILTHIYGI